jgi:hypothetical protein
MPAFNAIGWPFSQGLLGANARKVAGAQVMQLATSGGQGWSRTAALGALDEYLVASSGSTCQGNVAGAHLGSVGVGDRSLTFAPPPNTGVPVGLGDFGYASLTTNRQTLSAGRARVSTLSARVPLGNGRVETVNIGATECGQKPAVVTPPVAARPPYVKPAAPRPVPAKVVLPVAG